MSTKGLLDSNLLHLTRLIIFSQWTNGKIGQRGWINQIQSWEHWSVLHTQLTAARWLLSYVLLRTSWRWRAPSSSRSSSWCTAASTPLRPLTPSTCWTTSSRATFRSRTESTGASRPESASCRSLSAGAGSAPRPQKPGGGAAAFREVLPAGSASGRQRTRSSVERNTSLWRHNSPSAQRRFWKLRIWSKHCEKNPPNEEALNSWRESASYLRIKVKCLTDLFIIIFMVAIFVPLWIPGSFSCERII